MVSEITPTVNVPPPLPEKQQQQQNPAPKPQKHRSLQSTPTLFFSIFLIGVQHYHVSRESLGLYTSTTTIPDTLLQGLNKKNKFNSFPWFVLYSLQLWI